MPNYFSCLGVTCPVRFEVASTDLVELENKKKGLSNAIDNLMDEVS